MHAIDAGDGIVTPGSCSVEYQQFLWDTLQVPADMRSLRVFDVGTYDFVLGHGSVVKLADIDQRLSSVPLYRFYRFNELKQADYSN